MKADELRGYLREWSQENLLRLYTATYRRVPKNAKEEIDEIVKTGYNVPKAKPEVKKPTASNLKKTIEELDLFLGKAIDGKYYFENSEVSKKEKSNWRFTCKRFLKFFFSFGEGTPEFDVCNRQLCKIYDVLARACYFYTFVTQDPFHALGYESQKGFYGLIAKRVIEGNRDEQLLTEWIECGCKGNYDYMTSGVDIYRTILGAAAGKVDFDEILRITKKIRVRVGLEYTAAANKKGFEEYDSQNLALTRQMDALENFIPYIYIAMGEPLKAYQYAMDSYLNLNKEVTLFCLLYDCDADDGEWIQIYEKGLKDKIKPRDSLKKEYQKRKEGSKKT